MVSPQPAHLAADLVAELPAARRQGTPPSSTRPARCMEAPRRARHRGHPPRPCTAELPPPACAGVDPAEIDLAPAPEVSSQDGAPRPPRSARRRPRRRPGGRGHRSECPGTSKPAAPADRASSSGKRPPHGLRHSRGPRPPPGSSPAWRVRSAARYHSGVTKALPRATARRRQELEHRSEGVLPVYQLDLQAASREHLRKHPRRARYRIGWSPLERSSARESIARMTPADTERGRPHLARPPHLQRGLEPGGDRRRRSSTSSCPPQRICWSSTTPRPTAPGRSPTGWRPSTTDVSVLHRARKQGLGPAYVAGFREALAGGAAPHRPDGRRLLPRPGGPAPPGRRRRAMPTWCSARATCRAAGSRTGVRSAG